MSVGQRLHFASTLIDIDGLPLNVRTVDGEGDETFVLVHGLGVSSHYFGPLAEQLVRHGRVVVLNLPGFGPVARPGKSLRIEQFAQVARKAASELEIDRAVWVGHSMGAEVVVEAVRQDPGIASRVVLLAPVVDADERRPAQVLWRFFRSATHEPLSSAAASVRAFMSCGPRWLFNIFPAMIDYRIEDGIADLDADLLVVSGVHDRVSPAGFGHELARRAGGRARSIEIEGAHQAMHSHPREVAALIVGEPLGSAPVEQVTEPSRSLPQRLGALLGDFWGRLRSFRQQPVAERERHGVPWLGDPRLVRIAIADWVIAGRDQLLALRPEWEPADTAQVDAECSGRAIILLPGILESARYLRPMAHWFAAQGHVVHRLPALGWNLAGLQESVDAGFEALAALGVEDAVIVAHSKGGLIGKAMLLDPRSEPILRGMVAVATPFSGSKFWKRVQSNRWIRRSPLDLFHPENVLLVELSAADRVNAKIVSLAPEFDQMIPQGSELVGATNRTIPI